MVTITIKNNLYPRVFDLKKKGQNHFCPIVFFPAANIFRLYRIGQIFTYTNSLCNSLNLIVPNSIKDGFLTVISYIVGFVQT